MQGLFNGLKAGSGPIGQWLTQFTGGLGGAGVGSVPGAPSSVKGNAAILQRVAGTRGWGSGANWNALYQLVMHESGFRNTAQNPTSSAYGMFQFLNSTWKSVGGHKTSDPGLQSVYGLKYISQSYGNPLRAWSKWLSRSPHWYDQGGWLMPGVTMAVNNTGRPERILPPGRSSISSSTSSTSTDTGLTINGDVNVTVPIDRLSEILDVAEFAKLLKDQRINGRRTARSGTVRV